MMNFYPALSRYFENKTDLAAAGCMSRARLYQVLSGAKEFTAAEKKAIAANIIARRGISRNITDHDVEIARRAFGGEFDEVYRVKAA